jgi:arylformamidase
MLKSTASTVGIAPGAPWIDLTLPIWPGMPYNPDHFPPELTRYATIDTNSWEASRLVIDTHLGTHVDAPRHFVPGGQGVDRLDLGSLIGASKVLALPDCGAGARITAAELPDERATRVLLATGWSETALGRDVYFADPPVLDLSAADRLVGAGTRLVGIDGPTVDLDGEVHRRLLGAGCVIVENLVNLTQLGSSAEVIILPLPLLDGDGSPVRALGRPADPPGHSVGAPVARDG